MWHDVVNFLMQPFWPTINRVVTLIVCPYAILVGSWRERFVGAVYLAGFVAVEALASVSHLHSLPLGFLADILTLPGFLRADYKSPYSWTRWAAISQVLSAFTDIIDLLSGEAYSTACQITLGILSYGVLTSLLVGTVSAQRRRRTAPKDELSQEPDLNS